MIDQNSQFLAILTNVGVAKQANADALGIPWKITQMGVGDANGTEPQPSATQTALINERRRAPLNQLKVDPVNAGIIIAEQVIPEDVGGWWIREIGLYDTDNDLVAVANCAPSFKPLLAQGSGRTQVVRMNMIVSNSSNVELKIDPSVVLATRAYVDTKVQEEIYKLDSKQSVRVATTANIALTGLQTLDGIALVAGDRVLVKNQTLAKDNGLYVAAAGAWARAADADGSPEVTSALQVSVEQGATQADTSWQLVTDGAIVLGTTALTFQNSTQVFIQNALAALGLGASTGTLVTDLDALSMGGLYYTATGATGNPTSPAVGYIVIHAQGAANEGFQLATTRSTVAANKRMMFWRQRFNGTWGAWESSAQLDSPTFTGTPLAPTAPDTSNSTQIATTAHVLARLVTAGLYTQSSGGPSGNDADTVGAAQVEARSTISTTANAPMPQWTKVLALPVDASNGVQLSLGVQADRAFYRRKSVGVFQPWLEFAFLGSPTFTGTPAGPTAAPGTNSTQLATTAFVAALGALKANLASPTFTGTPAGPTAAPGANSTQLATTAFVATAIANLIASSPGALDTLNELAAALGNDPNFATTMVNALALKAPLASPTFTGNPTGPTPAQFDNDTSLATTAFVQAALGNKRTATSISASRAITLADFGGEFVVSASAGSTLTLPSAATVANGASIHLVNLGLGACTLARTGADAFIGAFNTSGTATSFSLLPNDEITVTQYGGLWLVIGSGALPANTGANGYRYLGGGLFEQWGEVIGSANPANGRWEFDVVFPTAFPTQCLSVVACAGISTTDLDASDGAGSTYRANKTNWQVGLPLPNKFEATVWYTDVPNNVRHFSWRAIGK